MNKGGEVGNVCFITISYILYLSVGFITTTQSKYEHLLQLR